MLKRDAQLGTGDAPRDIKTLKGRNGSLAKGGGGGNGAGEAS